MDLEKNKQRLEILAAEIEELKNSGGGGGGTVDAYTKAEADNKFAEKTNVYTKTEADNKFAEKATTYTKTEVDEAIAAAGGGLPAYVNLPTGSNAYFPEDKMEILEKHLPFTTSNPPTSTSPVYLFIGNYGSSYVYKKFANDGSTGTLEINQNTRRITLTQKSGGGGTIYDINSANYMRYVLSRPSDTLSTDSNSARQVYTVLIDNYQLDVAISPRMVICETDARAATCISCPTTKAFYMLIDTYASRPTQTLFEMENPAIFYRRMRLASDAWTAWYKFEGTAIT